jgi:hypothetical protein
MLSAGKKDTTNPPPVKEPKGEEGLRTAGAPVSTIRGGRAPPAPVAGTQPRDMRLLVITANGDGAELRGHRSSFLDYLGTPYETVIAANAASCRP